MEKLIITSGFHIAAALLDALTNEAISGATKVLKSATSSDVSIVLVDANNDLIPQKKGVATIVVVNTWTYTDSVSGEEVTKDLTTSVDVQVVDGPEGVLQVITFVPFDLPAAPAPDQSSQS